MIGVYAVYDRVAQTILGGLHLHRHPASAVRMFSDVATAEGNMVHNHPADFDLVQLGNLDDDHTIPKLIPFVPNTILEGSAWAAMQQINTEEE